MLLYIIVFRHHGADVHSALWVIWHWTDTNSVIVNGQFQCVKSKLEAMVQQIPENKDNFYTCSNNVKE